MAINTSQIAQLLRPGLDAVFGDMPTYPEQWTEIFKTHKSEMSYEIDVEMKFLGAADIKAEGANYSSDTMSQKIVNIFRHSTVGLMFEITKEALEDNLYKTQFPQQAASLKNALKVAKNILGASILNNAFNTSFLLGDGQPLCSNAHPIEGGVYSNSLAGNANVDFSEAGVEAAIIAIQKFPMQSGILAQVMPKKLIVPRELQFAASRLLNSQFRTDTANNDINALYHGDYIPQGYRVNQYLTSPSSWFILTDADNGMKHFQRTPVATDVYVNFMNDNLQCKASERYSFGCANPRAIFGSPGV